MGYELCSMAWNTPVRSYGWAISYKKYPMAVFYGRMGDFVGEPVQNAIGGFIFNEKAQAIMMEGARNAERGVVAYNSTENFILHVAMAIAGGVIGFQSGNLKDGEFKKICRNVSNFKHRTWSTSRITCLTTPLAMGAAWQNTNGLVETVWAGLGAAVLTELAYKHFVRPKSRSELAAVLCPHFDQLDPSLYAGQSTIDPDKKTWAQKAKSFLSRDFVKAAGATMAVATTADIVLNHGHGTLQTIGGSAVVGLYILLDLVEDNIAHVVYYGATFTALYPIGLAYKKVKQLRDTLEKSYIYPDHLKRGTPESQWKDQQNKLG